MYKKTLIAAVILGSVAAPVAAYAASHGELGSRTGHTSSHATSTGHHALATTNVTCVGSATSCTATVSLAGGASNEKVAIALPDPGVRLESVKPTSPNLDGSYLVSDQARGANGRQYTFTLSAAEAPQGSALKFTFHTPGQVTPQIVRCTGGATCTAKVGIGGGASNRLVVVQLPRTDLGLVSVKPSSPTLKGAYSLSDQRLRQGDSEYQFRLNAVQATPAGSTLTLTFSRY